MFAWVFVHHLKTSISFRIIYICVFAFVFVLVTHLLHPCRPCPCLFLLCRGPRNHHDRCIHPLWSWLLPSLSSGSSLSSLFSWSLLSSRSSWTSGSSTCWSKVLTHPRPPPKPPSPPPYPPRRSPPKPPGDRHTLDYDSLTTLMVTITDMCDVIVDNDDNDKGDNYLFHGPLLRQNHPCLGPCTPRVHGLCCLSGC